MSLPPFHEILRHEKFQAAPLDTKFKITQDYWDDFKKQNPDKADYADAQRDDAFRLVTAKNNTPFARENFVQTLSDLGIDYGSETPGEIMEGTLAGELYGTFDLVAQGTPKDPVGSRVANFRAEQISRRMGLRDAVAEGAIKSQEELDGILASEKEYAEGRAKDIEKFQSAARINAEDLTARDRLLRTMREGSGMSALAGANRGAVETFKTATNELVQSGQAGAMEVLAETGGDVDAALGLLGKKRKESGQMAESVAAGVAGGAMEGPGAKVFLRRKGEEISQYGQVAEETLKNMKKVGQDLGLSPEKLKSVLLDTAKTVGWGEKDGYLRKLSTGELAINPNKVFGDREAVVKAINESDATPEQKELAIHKLDVMRESMSGKMWNEMRIVDKGFEEFSKGKWQGPSTDKAAVLDEWSRQQGDRWKVHKLGDAVWEGIIEGSGGIIKTAFGTASGVTLGQFEGVNELYQQSREASNMFSEAAKLRGLVGPYGVTNELVSTVTQMAPMFIGGSASAVMKGLSSALASNLSVYGWAAAQGYESMGSNVLDKLEAELDRPLTPEDIGTAFSDPMNQVAMFANAVQTAALSKILGGGVERAALGKAAESMTVADFLSRGGRAALRNGTFRNEMRKMGKTFFKDVGDEFVEEGLNQALEGLISVGALGTELKLGDLLVDSFKAAAMGGVVGGFIPQIRSGTTHDKTDDELRAIANRNAVQSAKAAQENLPAPQTPGGIVPQGGVEGVAEDAPMSMTRQEFYDFLDTTRAELQGREDLSPEEQERLQAANLPFDEAVARFDVRIEEEGPVTEEAVEERTTEQTVADGEEFLKKRGKPLEIGDPVLLDGKEGRITGTPKGSDLISVDFGDGETTFVDRDKLTRVEPAPEQVEPLADFIKRRRGEAQVSPVPVKGAQAPAPTTPPTNEEEKGQRQGEVLTSETSPELLTPEQWIASGNKKGEQWSKVLSQAVKDGKPINVRLYDQVMSGTPDGYVKDGAIYRKKDLTRAPKDMVNAELAEVSQAISEKPENKAWFSKISTHVGQFFDPLGKGLSELFKDESLRKQLRMAMDPVRKMLREKFGDSLTVYRAEDPSTEKTNSRDVFSWTLDRETAEKHAKGVKRARIRKAVVPVDTVLWFGNPNETEVLLSETDVRASGGEPTVKRTKEGIWEVVVSGKTRRMFRDPDSGAWLDPDQRPKNFPNSPFPYKFLGYNRQEALDKIFAEEQLLTTPTTTPTNENQVQEAGRVPPEQGVAPVEEAAVEAEEGTPQREGEGEEVTSDEELVLNIHNAMLELVGIVPTEPPSDDDTGGPVVESNGQLRLFQNPDTLSQEQEKDPNVTRYLRKPPPSESTVGLLNAVVGELPLGDQTDAQNQTQRRIVKEVQAEMQRRTKPTGKGDKMRMVVKLGSIKMNELLGRIWRMKNRGLPGWQHFKKTEDVAERARILAHEIVSSLTKPGSGIDWYRGKINEMYEKLSRFYPELREEGQDRFIFSTILAITSNGENVFSNMVHTLNLYNKVRGQGRMPTMEDATGEARREPAMFKGFAAVQKQIDKDGWEKVDADFRSDTTYKEMRKKYKLTSQIDELPDQTVSNAFMLGSKIGAFWGNLNGNFNHIAMDLWFTRTMARLSGDFKTLKPKQISALTKQFRMLTHMGNVPEEVKTELQHYLNNLPDLDRDPNWTSVPEEVRQQIPNAYKWVKDTYNAYSRRKDPVSGRSFYRGTEEDVAAKNALVALDGANRAPDDAEHRDWMRRVMKSAQRHLKNNGIDMSLAEMQAVMWFYEKDLYTKFGATSKRGERADFSEAADHALAKVRQTRFTGDAGPRREDVEQDLFGTVTTAEDSAAAKAKADAAKRQQVEALQKRPKLKVQQRVDTPPTMSKKAADGPKSANEVKEYANRTFGRLARRLGVEIVPNYTGYEARYVVKDAQGENYIEYNPRSMVGKSPSEIYASFREELIHAASDRALQARGQTWTEFYSGLASVLTKEEKEKIKKIYRSAKTPVDFGAEYFRMGIQKLLDGTVTEAEVRSSAFQKILDLLKDVVAFFQSDPRTEGVYRQVFDDTVAMLRNAEAAGVDTLRQEMEGTKGQVTFSGLARAFIQYFEKADGSTAVHEPIHVARRFLLNRSVPPAQRYGITDEMIDASNAFVGAIDSNWTVEQEEKFARAFERYLWEGASTGNAKVDSLMERLKKLLQQVYKTIEGSSLDINLTPEIKELFNQLLTRGERLKAEGAAPTPVDIKVEVKGKPAPAPAPAPKKPKPVKTVKRPRLKRLVNAEIDAELARMGMAPVAVPASRALPDTWDEAFRITTRDRDIGPTLVQSLLDDPRPITDVQHGILLTEMIRRKKALGRAHRDVMAAQADGNENPVVELNIMDKAVKALNELFLASRMAGSEWGRAGRFRQISVNDDYEIEAMSARFAAEINKGGALNEAQVAYITEMSKKLKAAQDKIAELEAKVSQEEVSRVEKQNLKEIAKQAKKEREAPKSNQYDAVLGRVKSLARSERDFLFKAGFVGEETLSQREEEFLDILKQNEESPFQPDYETDIEKSRSGSRVKLNSKSDSREDATVIPTAGGATLTANGIVVGQFDSVQEAVKAAPVEGSGYVSADNQKPPDYVSPEGLSPTVFNSQADGYAETKPYPSYGEAIKAGAKGNVWVRQASDSGSSNENRVLMVQIASPLMYSESRDTKADAFFNALYSKRKGYLRPDDFWEIPTWQAMGSKAIGDKGDIYVVRNIDEAVSFLKEAGYGSVMFSVMDTNKDLVKQIAPSIKGRLVLGGYTDTTDIEAIHGNAARYESIREMAESLGYTYEGGVDYSLFRGTETIPRLSLSDGCRHRCKFCSLAKTKLKEVPESEISQQVDAFSDLTANLIYINDKTFGQAGNYTQLPAIFAKVKAKNPDFNGFVVQTTAAQMRLIPEDFYTRAGIRFVEIGVETYNDALLRDQRKPANEKLLDEAARKLRRAGVAMIPNIIIGFPGETAETYARTRKWLEDNADIISHPNIYNLTIYGEAELSSEIQAGASGDVDENAPLREKTFISDVAHHEAFSNWLYEWAAGQLDTSPKFTPEMDPTVWVDTLRQEPEPTPEPLPTEILRALANVGAEYLLEGVKGNAFNEAMLKEFGSKIKPHLKRILESAKSKANAAKLQMRGPKTIQQVIKGMDEENPKLTRDLVFNLARAAWHAGHRDAAILDTVTEELQSVMPGVTRQEVSNAFTGYGKITEPSKDDDLVAMRKLRNVERIQSQIEDVMAGRHPKKTGMQRDTPDEEIRRLQSELKDAMLSAGLLESPEPGTLKGPMDKVKTQLNNRIEALDNAIRFNNRLPNNRNRLQYDEEVENLRKQRDELQDLYDEIFHVPHTLTEQQREERAIAALTRMIDMEKRLAAEGRVAREKGLAPVNTPAVKALRTDLKALVDARHELAKRLKGGLTPEQKALLRAEHRAQRALDRTDEILSSGNFPVTVKRPPSTSDLLTAFRDQLKENRREIAKLRAKAKLSPRDAQIRASIKALEKSNQAMEDAIAAGDLVLKSRPDSSVYDPRLSRLRLANQRLREGLRDLRNAARPAVTPEQRALKAQKTAVQRRIREVRERLAKKDYTRPVKRSVVPDKELADAQVEYYKLVEEWNKGFLDAQLKRSGLTGRAWDKVNQTLNVSRAMMTSVDYSAMFRQGGFMVLGHPIVGLKALGRSFAVTFSESRMVQLEKEIKKNRAYALSQQAKLYIAERDSQNLSKMEEAYRSRWARKWPMRALVVPSERSYVGFLNKLRMDTFEQMVNGLGGVDRVTPEEARVIARFVNIATGRGDLGKFETAADAAATLFFSPKFVVSRFQLVGGLATVVPNAVFSRAETRRAHQAVARQYARSLGGIAAMYMMIQMARAAMGDDDEPIETDPRSSDFGKVKVGNSRIDVMGGIIQTAVVISRLVTNEKISSKGVVIDLYRPGYGQDSALTVAGRFIWSKAAPVWTTLAAIRTGENAVGEPTTALAEGIGAFTPLSFRDIYDSMREYGVAQGLSMAMLALFGIGVQTRSDEMNFNQLVASWTPFNEPADFQKKKSSGKSSQFISPY